MAAPVVSKGDDHESLGPAARCPENRAVLAESLVRGEPGLCHHHPVRPRAPGPLANEPAGRAAWVGNAQENDRTSAGAPAPAEAACQRSTTARQSNAGALCTKRNPPAAGLRR